MDVPRMSNNTVPKLQNTETLSLTTMFYLHLGKPSFLFLRWR
jgi:hypothetical protein